MGYVGLKRRLKIGVLLVDISFNVASEPELSLPGFRARSRACVFFGSEKAILQPAEESHLLKAPALPFPFLSSLNVSISCDSLSNEYLCLVTANTINAETPDFSFVVSLPKREQARLATAWDKWEQAKAVMASDGALMPFAFAASLGGVSSPRIHQLCQAGDLTVVSLGGHRYVTEKSFMLWVSSERKAGRPMKAGVGALVRGAKEWLKETEK